MMKEKFDDSISGQPTGANQPPLGPAQMPSVCAGASDGRPTSPAQYFGSIMPRSSASILAMVDEGGDLVRVVTAADLLRAFRAVWKLEE